MKTNDSELFKGKIHPAEKPSRLAEIMIETSSKKGELVLDMFAGSGSTGVAAKKLGRSCLLIEKSNCKMHEGLR
jgi:DNA modification methylase